MKSVKIWVGNGKDYLQSLLLESGTLLPSGTVLTQVAAEVGQPPSSSCAACAHSDIHHSPLRCCVRGSEHTLPWPAWYQPQTTDCVQCVVQQSEPAEPEQQQATAGSIQLSSSGGRQLSADTDWLSSAVSRLVRGEKAIDSNVLVFRAVSFRKKSNEIMDG